ncbi:DNA/RNA helicase domain-containing protein [Muricoccus aerilatus]|uniref:DNA/RNA helicase domain-containing protein n=1 Tax=Muricoccus aerilatus TaxID=452982 RepID=UPI00146FD8CF|nr:DNA/RNA helicase domain-containing protein [Roseomonas aerilata]
MICALHSPATSFIRLCAKGGIGTTILEGFRERFGYVPGASEQRSWAASLSALAQVMADHDVEEVDVFVELQMPLSSARCDVLLVGRNEHSQPTAIVVELKQWSSVSQSALRDTVSVLGRPETHPSVQTRGYVNYLRNFHGAFAEGHLSLFGCTFLHNMTSQASLKLLLSEKAFDTAPREHPVFAGVNPAGLGVYLKRHIGGGHVSDVEALILRARVQPSTKLLDLVDAAVQGNHEWRLLDEQLLAFNQVISLVDQAKAKAGGRNLVAVRGGPGTGKSVIAIQLLAYAARQRWRIAHVTGSKAFQTVLQAKTQHFADAFIKRLFNTRYKNNLPVKELFTTFRDVAKLGSTGGQQLDLVIGDEGHRLWDHRRNVRTYQVECDVPMIEEMLLAAPVTVIFLDDDQGVRANEIGSVQYLKEHAERLGVDFALVDLTTQFRCAGSKSYLDWAESCLGFNAPRSLAWRDYGGYDFRIATNVQSIVDELQRLASEGDRCRLVAGFCWRWSEPRPDGSLPHDVTDPRFRQWSAPWIEKGDRYANPSNHRYFRWASDEDRFDQVGSIYSVQGFEFDYVGVIFGDDLVIRNGQWCADLTRNKDAQFKEDLRRRASLGHTADAAAQLRNIYRVLLTRGMKGTFVYFLDDETRSFFEKALRSAHAVQADLPAGKVA